MIYRTALSILAFSILFNACTEKDTPEKIVETRYIIAPSGLNIRSQPSASAAAVVLLPYGTEVMVLGEQPEISNWQGLEGRWTEVQSGDMRGWAFGAFLAKEKPTAPDVVGIWADCSPERRAYRAITLYRGGRSQVHHAGMEDFLYGNYVQSGNTVQLFYDNAGPEVYTLQADGELCIDESSEGMGYICLCRK